MKIYTKTGDNGETSLIGGERVPKYHLRVEAYGSLDELNSYIGLIICHIKNQQINQILKLIQYNLFKIETLIAVGTQIGSNTEFDSEKYLMTEQDVTILEEEIDKMNTILPELKNFILPSGNIAMCYCHVARTVCRRAERIIIKLDFSDKISDRIMIKYINRLSDYLFTLARYLGHIEEISEIKWISKSI